MNIDIDMSTLPCCDWNDAVFAFTSGLKNVFSLCLTRVYIKFFYVQGENLFLHVNVITSSMKCKIMLMIKDILKPKATKKSR
jgi:hypothetical protein